MKFGLYRDYGGGVRELLATYTDEGEAVDDARLLNDAALEDRLPYYHAVYPLEDR